MLRKIVAGVDGRPGGADAAALASALAGAETDVLLAGVYPNPLLPLPLRLGRDVHLGEETERVLREVRDAHAPQARTQALCDTFPARALRHLAEGEYADLLVLGSTHRAAEGCAAAGRRARQVIHGAPCPVALAARGLAREPGRPRRIVVGLDGSPEADAALAAAAALAGEDETRITVVAVVDDRLPTTMTPLGASLELGRWDEVVQERRGHAEQLVERATAERRRAGEVRVGVPAKELAHAAQGADLLVIGSRRWGALERIVVGSTAEDLLHAAPCSLLLVRRPAEAQATVEAPVAEAAG